MARLVRQAKVEHDQIRWIILRCLQRRHAVWRFVHLVALRGEANAKQLADRGLVVNDEDFYG
ncbi:hypothetical protein D3C86_2191240 [compost metagenome]